MPVRPRPDCTSSTMSSVPYLSAEPLGLGEISIGDDFAGLALDRFDDERGRLAWRLSAFSSAGRSLNGILLVPGSSSPKRSRKKSAPLSDERAGGQAVKRVIAVDDVAGRWSSGRT